MQQDVFLFSDSVTHNIAYAKPEAEQSEVENAARLAAADKFIEELPNKYATEIGERGVKLSGGQKQRLAIARVFLKNPAYCNSRRSDFFFRQLYRKINTGVVGQVGGK